MIDRKPEGKKEALGRGYIGEPEPETDTSHRKGVKGGSQASSPSPRGGKGSALQGLAPINDRTRRGASMRGETR